MLTERLSRTSLDQQVDDLGDLVGGHRRAARTWRWASA